MKETNINAKPPSTPAAGSAPERETRRWWAVTDTGVRLVTGHSCAPNNPQIWWCPEAGYSLTEGHHLFDTEKKAMKKVIAETNAEVADLQKHLRRLMRQNVRGQAGRAKRVQPATERRTRPCLHRVC